MNPVLFRVPFLDVPYHAYGFFLAVAFLSGIALSVREGKRQGFPANQIVQLCFISIVTSLLGSRLLHLVMVERSAFFSDPAMFFRFTKGGYAFYGGLLVGMATTWTYSRIQGWRGLQLADVWAPGIVFGLMFGRTGCLLAGCCHGRPIEAPLPGWLAGVLPFQWPSWFALSFPADAGGLGSIHDHPLVPTQPLSGLACLAIFLVLVLLVAPKKRYHGQVFVWMYLLYALARSTVELFRGDDRGLYFDEALSTSQLVSVPVALLGLGILIWARMRLKSGALQPLPAGWRARSREAGARIHPPTPAPARSAKGGAKKRKKRRH
ncbi:MAG: prolipoprotein diacylglyceryl transferase [Myxococcota bacterium]|nr:prolipoprotein diacylglyceryl transferase [Myxococcota bacterium]